MTLLTAEEAATLLRLDVKSVYNLAAKGIVPTVRLGRKLRFSREVLEEFIREGGKGCQWRRPRRNPPPEVAA